MNDFKFPDSSQHTTIIGRTGSGKTQAGAFLLSQANFDQMPYIIIDYKGDELLNSVTAENISLHSDPPTKPGLYIVHPLPDEEETMDAFLWKVWAHGNTGLYFDEGFMVAKMKSLEAILMQGRSKNIPCYVLSQRPAWMNRYAFSEASHFCVFHLNDHRDQLKVKEFFRGYDEERVHEYHSQWYDVKRNKNFHLLPVPDAVTIRERIVERLDEMRKTKRHKHFI